MNNIKPVLLSILIFLSFIFAPISLAQEDKKYLKDISEIEKVLDEQKKLVDGAEKVLQEIDKRKSWIIFVIGTDYRKVEELQKTVEENNKKLDYFQNVMNKVGDQAEQEKIANTISRIRSFNSEVEDRIRNQKNRFSLLGWLFQMFEKY